MYCLECLIMSIVARSVRCAGFGAFRPSCMCCVSVVRKAAVECFGLKLHWVGGSSMSGVILLKYCIHPYDVSLTYRHYEAKDWT